MAPSLVKSLGSFFCSYSLLDENVIQDVGEKRSDIGISGLLNESENNLVPKRLKRLERREEYETNPAHASQKD